MATRSMIGVEENGKIIAVYCHFDGYLDGVGQTLQDYYSNRTKIQKLLDLGDMSTLGKGVEHCEFYGRDRNESDTDARTYATRAELFEKQWDCEYFYLWVDNHWIYSQGKAWNDLKEILEQLEAEDAE